MATKLSPLDDSGTYLTIAQQQYRNALNPKAVNASREATAGTSSPANTPNAQPTSQTDPKTGISFTKTFTPQERAAQKAALAAKLQQMHDEDASTGEQQ